MILTVQQQAYSSGQAVKVSPNQNLLVSVVRKRALGRPDLELCLLGPGPLPIT